MQCLRSALVAGVGIGVLGSSGTAEAAIHEMAAAYCSGGDHGK